MDEAEFVRPLAADFTGALLQRRHENSWTDADTEHKKGADCLAVGD